MKRHVYVLNVLILFIHLHAPGQSYSDIANEKSGNISFQTSSIVGLWKVLEVKVGNEFRTPTAKWFEFLSDGTLTSGNGWVQNMAGSYNHDLDKKELLQSNQGNVDEYGAFKTSIEQDRMIWQRVEDGIPVKVTLVKTLKKPLAPWDIIVGSWVIDKAEGLNPQTGKVSSTYMVEPDRYFFRWDRRYVKFDKDGKRTETGLWHIEAHSPWLWTINDADNAKTGWSIEIIGNKMTWTKENDKETMLVHFSRTDN